jgi:hypothetical protein
VGMRNARKGKASRADLSEGEVTEQEKLKREIYVLGQIIGANASVLASKTMSDGDRELLERQMTTRMTHQKLLQQRLDRLSPRMENRSRRNLP